MRAHARACTIASFSQIADTLISKGAARTLILSTFHHDACTRKQSKSYLSTPSFHSYETHRLVRAFPKDASHQKGDREFRQDALTFRMHSRHDFRTCKQSTPNCSPQHRSHCYHNLKRHPEKSFQDSLHDPQTLPLYLDLLSDCQTSPCCIVITAHVSSLQVSLGSNPFHHSHWH